MAAHGAADPTAAASSTDSSPTVSRTSRRVTLVIAATSALAVAAWAGSSSIDSSAVNFNAAMPALEVVDGHVRTWSDDETDDALSRLQTFSCARDDDDEIYMTNEGCMTGDASTCQEYLLSSGMMPHRSALPYFQGSEFCAPSCYSDLNRTWGVPCSWQLIANLPDTCAGVDTTNISRLIHSRNKAPDEDAYTFDIEYDGNTKTQYGCATSALSFVARSHMFLSDSDATSAAQATSTRSAARARTKTGASTSTARR